MALRGTLGDFSITDILQLIALQRKSGLLVLRRESGQISLGFEDGKIVTADSSARSVEQRVGSLLVRTGKLTEDRLQQALEIQKQTLKRLGHVLVEKNWVRAESIQSQLTLQMSETVYELFRWRTGEYDFQPDAHIEWDREFVCPLPCEHLLMEGARMIDEWPMIERTIKSFSLVLRPTAELAPLLASVDASADESGSIFENDIEFDLISADPLENKKPGSPKLSNFEQRVIKWIDGVRNVAEVAELSELGTFEAMKTMAGMVDRRLLEPVAAMPVESEKGRSQPLFAHAGPARVVMVVAFVLALVGGISTTQEIVRGIWPQAAQLPLPRPITTSDWLADQSGLDDLGSATSRARLIQISSATRAFRLDKGRWPADLAELVELGLLSTSEAYDPWGRPYAYEWFPDGFQVAETARVAGRDPLSLRHQIPDRRAQMAPLAP